MTPDSRQRFDQPREVPGLAALPPPFPVGMVTVLPPAGGIAAHRLQGSGSVFGIGHIDVSGRHREARKPLDDERVANPPAIFRVIGKAASATPTLDGQGVALSARLGLARIAGGSLNPGRHTSFGLIVLQVCEVRGVKSGLARWFQFRASVELRNPPQR